MAKLFQFRKGNKTQIPRLQTGEPGYCLDTNELLVGTPDGNKKINDVLMVTSPNGTKYKIKVNDAGVLTSEVIV